ncbi:hypothetical protein D3C77_506230 [compost metagenome]
MQLVAVSVNELHCGLLAKVKVSMVHIADNEASLMKHSEGRGSVPGGDQEEIPTTLWELLFALRRTVQRLNRLHAADLLHCEANNWTTGTLVKSS